jgi:aminoglycoside phosphotransferase (APT) family kinase protein
VRAALEGQLGSAVVDAISQPTGFSPGVAARLRLADGRRFFVKVIGPDANPDTPSMHRREAQVVAALPASAPVPRLMGTYDEGEGGWVALVFEEAQGQMPAQPWRDDELARVLAAMADLAKALTPSPLPVGKDIGSASDEFAERMCGWRQLRDEQPSHLDQLDAWSLRDLDALAAYEERAARAVAGETLLHFDLRADNMLLSPERVWFVDWPLACVGAAWVDVVFFAPSVHMQGGPPPEQVIRRHPAVHSAEPAEVTAAVIAVAGFFTHRSLQPPPPGLPTVRAFQAAQGVVARQWVAERTGWW